jgi:hypothetical protein
MNYFTKEWASGGLEEEEWERAVPEYQAHIDSIIGKLSPSLNTFLNSISIHDALINHVDIDEEKSTVKIQLVNGDIQTGYRNLKMTYSGVDFLHLDLDKLAHLARDRRTELLYDEIDCLENGYFIHRILSYGRYQNENYIDIEFRFEDFTFVETPRADRTVDGGGDPIYFIDDDEERAAIENLP